MKSNSQTICTMLEVLVKFFQSSGNLHPEDKQWMYTPEKNKKCPLKILIKSVQRKLIIHPWNHAGISSHTLLFNPNPWKDCAEKIKKMGFHTFYNKKVVIGSSKVYFNP